LARADQRSAPSAKARTSAERKRNEGKEADGEVVAVLLKLLAKVRREKRLPLRRPWPQRVEGDIDDEGDVDRPDLTAL
jgi:hypothetical protein